MIKDQNKIDELAAESYAGESHVNEDDTASWFEMNEEKKDAFLAGIAFGRALWCNHSAVDGDICCSCKMRVEREDGQYVLSTNVRGLF